MHTLDSKFKRLLKVLFIIYADIENTLKPATGNKNYSLNTKKYQDHIVCSYTHKHVRW